MRRWERRSYARRREIGDKCGREKLFVNLSHSTPAHQKKPKTRHFLVVLFWVSFNFSDIFTLYYPKSVKRYRSAMKQGFSVAERRKLFLFFLLQKKSPDRHRSLLLKVFWKIFLFYRHAWQPYGRFIETIVGTCPTSFTNCCIEAIIRLIRRRRAESMIISFKTRSVWNVWLCEGLFRNIF